MLFSLTLVLFVSCIRVAGWVWLVLMHPHHFPPQDKVLDQTIGKCPNRLTRPEEAVDLKTGLWSTFMCVYRLESCNYFLDPRFHPNAEFIWDNVVSKTCLQAKHHLVFVFHSMFFNFTWSATR